MNRTWKSVIVVIMTVVALGTWGSAQQNNQGRGNQPGGVQQGQGGQGFQGGQGGRGFDPAQFRQTLSEQMKLALEATDEEWTILGPKIEKIQQIQTDSDARITGALGLLSRAGRRGQGGGGQGGGGGGRGGFDLSALLGPETPLRRKMAALQTAIDSKVADAELRQMLASIREDRERAKVELATARKELIELLTQRQEAILFQMGIIE